MRVHVERCAALGVAQRKTCINHAGAAREHETRVGVAKVVRSSFDAGRVGRSVPDVCRPMSPRQHAATIAGDDQLVISAAAVRGDVLSKTRDDWDAAALACLRRFDATSLSRLLNEYQFGADVSPCQAADLGWAQPGVRDQADDQTITFGGDGGAQLLDLIGCQGSRLCGSLGQALDADTRVVLDQIIVDGGAKACGELADALVGRVSRAALLNDRFAEGSNAFLAEARDDLASEHGEDPLLEDALAIDDRSVSPFATVELEPFDDPIVDGHAGIDDGDADWFGCDAESDASVSQARISVRGERSRVLPASRVAPHDAPSSVSVLGPVLVDAHLVAPSACCIDVTSVREQSCLPSLHTQGGVVYEITTEPDNDAGSQAILCGLERGERVARIELAYSAWKSNGDGSSESRRSAFRRIVEPNRRISVVTNEAQIRTVFDSDVAFLLYLEHCAVAS